MIASLPMYDWPAVQQETNRLWALLRDALRCSGLEAPEALNRTIPEDKQWTHADLLLSQTCGLPFVKTLRGRVHLLGTPDYGVRGCPAGWYNSVLIARADEHRNLEALAQASIVMNSLESQSGCFALLDYLLETQFDPGTLGSISISGGHAQSVMAVAEGRADIAAIDAVSWRLAQDHLALSASCRVVGHTRATPGLPLICGAGCDAASIRTLLAKQFSESKDSSTGLCGFWKSRETDYDVIANRAERVEEKFSVLFSSD